MSSKMFFALLSPALLTVPSVQAVTQAKPNVVFIFADDLGYGDLGCFGSKLNRTPNLDKMAQEGIRFTDSYSPAPVCSPSRAGLLTARYPIRAGINGVFFPESFSGIDNSEVLLPEILKENGYATGIVGKWHLGHLHPYLPLQNGFDEYFGIPYSNDMRSVVYLRGNEVESWKVDQNLITKSYTSEAIKFIERHKDHPFFLYLAHNMPHVPIFASDQFRGKSANGLYGDVIEELDWSVGEILKTLKNLGLEENTLVVFTSDNGPWLTEGPHGGSQGPLFQGKTTTWEGGQRVPAIARWKGKVRPSVCSGIISHLDWFPTIVSLAGGKMPADRLIDGKSFANTLTAGAPVENQEFFYLSNGKIEACRIGEYKLVLPQPQKKGNFWVADVPKHDTLLFHLTTDIAESVNLYFTHPEKVRELAAKLEQFRATLKEVTPSKVMTDRSAEEATGSNRRRLIEEAQKMGIKSKGGN